PGPGLNPEVTVTQTPAVESVLPGQTVSLKCRTSSNCLSWYQQKPGQNPKLMILPGNTLHSGTPSRFSGSGPGRSYFLHHHYHHCNAGDYYCQSLHYPNSVWVFTQ
uniref:Ig-like domain-containing protein n=1 Tax=Esox lucius TaxID=8010 RepID=A0AAY5L1H8_ESOLU